MPSTLICLYVQRCTYKMIKLSCSKGMMQIGDGKSEVENQRKRIYLSIHILSMLWSVWEEYYVRCEVMKRIRACHNINGILLTLFLFDSIIRLLVSYGGIR